MKQLGEVIMAVEMIHRLQSGGTLGHWMLLSTQLTGQFESGHVRLVAGYKKEMAAMDACWIMQSTQVQWCVNVIFIVCIYFKWQYWSCVSFFENYIQCSLFQEATSRDVYALILQPLFWTNMLLWQGRS